MDQFNRNSILNAELDVLHISIEGVLKQLFESGDSINDNIECAMNHQFNRVKSHVDGLQDYHIKERNKRANDPNGVFVKKGEMNEDQLVQMLEGFRNGEETV